MNKTKKELIDESSHLSSSRWSLITCVQWAIVIALISIIIYFISYVIGKPLPDVFLGGCAGIIAIIIAVPTTGKTVQSFTEYGNHYFDKFEATDDDSDEKAHSVENEQSDYDSNGK